MKNLAQDGNRLIPFLNEKTKPETKVAAGQVVHLIEGWLNFSGALSCLMHNEFSQAKHLAYYGELRSVLSLLAWSGVNTQYDDFYYFTHSGSICKENKVTIHKVAWLFWDEWIKSSMASSLLGNNINLNQNYNLSAIFQRLTALYSVQSRLLQTWGVDLSKACSDHFARNRASYGISLAETKVLESPEDPWPFIGEIWNLLMPKTRDILMFDVAFIKYALSRLSESSLDGDSKEISEKISNVLQYICYNDNMTYKFLQTDDCLKIFSYAEDGQTGPRNMLSRCLILLRIATLAMVNSARGSENIRVWLNNWLKNVILKDLNIQYNIQDSLVEFESAREQLNYNPLDNRSKSLLARPVACLAWGLHL